MIVICLLNTVILDQMKCIINHLLETFTQPVDNPFLHQCISISIYTVRNTGRILQTKRKETDRILSKTFQKSK